MPETHSLSELVRRFEEHMRDDEKLFSSFIQDVKTIKENHLTHIEKDLASIETSIAVNTTDTSWIKKAVIGGIGLSITTLISIVLLLIQLGHK